MTENPTWIILDPINKTDAHAEYQGIDPIDCTHCDLRKSQLDQLSLNIPSTLNCSGLDYGTIHITRTSDRDTQPYTGSTERSDNQTARCKIAGTIYKHRHKPGTKIV